MKKIKIIISFSFILLVVNSVFPQKLTVNDLTILISKPKWEEVNSYLINKGWEYYESEVNNHSGYTTTITTWSYNKGHDDTAEGWFYLNIYNKIPSKIRYSFSNNESYSLLINSISNTNFKIIKNNVLTNYVKSDYENSKYIMNITLLKITEEEYSTKTSYTHHDIEVIKKNSYYDFMNGEKIEYYEDGTVKETYRLKNGEINGEIKQYSQNGKLKLVGNYKEGLKNGKFIEYSEDGQIINEYNFLNGELDGKYNVFSDGKLIQEITYKNGQINGTYYEYHYDENNQLLYKMIGYYKNDSEDGRWNTYVIENGKEEILEYVTYNNGIKHGLFNEFLTPDTLITGNYKNGLLDGFYKKKVKINLNIIDSWFVDSEGYYKDGMKDGKWIYYFMGNKASEGSYYFDKKNGIWINYIIYEDHNGEIYSETNYSNDKKNGQFTRYFESETIQDSLNPKTVFFPIKECVFYENDIKQGKYTYEDSIMKVTGYFSDDIEDKNWKISRTDDSYIEIEYNKGEKKIAKYYDDYELYLIEKYKFNKIFECEYYKNNKLTEEHIVNLFLKKEYYVNVKEYKGDSIFSYSYIVKSNKDYSYELFLEYGYKEGIYKHFINDTLLVEGNYCKNKKCGYWIFEYPQINVYSSKLYKDNIIVEEQFFEKDNKKPYSGKISIIENGNKVLINTKKGFRHGKTTYYDSTGKILRVEKYKNGVLSN